MFGLVVFYYFISGYLPFREEDEFLNEELIVKGQFDKPKNFGIQLQD